MPRLRGIGPLVSVACSPGWRLRGLREDRLQPILARGVRLPIPLRLQPWMSTGTGAIVTHDRTVAGSTVARTRQVTVMKIICGVDVSASHLDARVGMTGAFARFDRTATGIGELGDFCRRHGVDLVVFEATGGYEKLPFCLLWQQGLACALVNPRAVRDLAKGLGYLEKTDRLDAGIIARFAEITGVEPQAPRSGSQERLRALVDRLRQLVVMNGAEKNRARLVEDETVAASLGRTRAHLEAEIRRIEGEVASAIDDDPLWSTLGQAFRTIKGVADRTVAVLAALLPEIGTLDNKAISKLVGLAPLADDSGRRTGRRLVRGGRRDVRDILFVVAEIVRRFNDDFRDFAKRLKEAGKPPKVIRVALAHKLLIRLNAKARQARTGLAMPT